MLPVQVYIDQIPAGARSTAPAAPAFKVSPKAAGALPEPPPGLYVRVATGVDPSDAIRAGLEFVERAGSGRPAFVRGVAAADGGRTRIQLFAGPFADRSAAESFCARTLAGAVCVLQPFPAAQAAGGGR